MNNQHALVTPTLAATTIKIDTGSLQLKIFLIAYACFLIINSFFQGPYFDAFYYWSWGQHLALGYLDGPPLVAYCMRLVSVIFGNTLFAINSYGVFTTLCAAFFVFKIATILANDKHIGLCAALFWLISNNTQAGLISRISYDNLEELFWLVTVFFVLQYLQLKLNRSLYYAGFALGLLLLSKYSGAILVLGLLAFFICGSQERIIFKNKHFYGAMLVTGLIFSPNLWWNFKHDWRTFVFQQHAHPMQAATHFLSLLNCLTEVIKHHIYAIPVISVLAIKHKFSHVKDNPLGWRLMGFVFFILLFLWLGISYFATVYYGYLLLLNVPIMILLAYYLIKFKYKKTLWVVITVYSLSSLIQIITYDLRSQYEIYELTLLQKFQKTYLAKSTLPIIVGGNYPVVAKVLFSNPKRKILTIAACEDQANQLQYWHHSLQHNLREHKLAQAFYIDFVNKPQCMQSYFQSCTQFPSFIYESSRQPFKKRVFAPLYIYKCVAK